MHMRTVRWMLMLVVLPVASMPALAQKPPALPDLLKITADAVAQYAQQLGTVAADEEFTQYETSSGHMSTPKRLNSVVVLYPQGDGAIVSFRDIAGIDTVPVRAKDDRLAALFQNPTDASVAHAQDLTEEAVKAYYSSNLHLLDKPMLALELVRAANQANSTFKIEGMKNMDGAQVAVPEVQREGHRAFDDRRVGNRPCLDRSGEWRGSPDRARLRRQGSEHPRYREIREGRAAGTVRAV